MNALHTRSSSNNDFDHVQLYHIDHDDNDVINYTLNNRNTLRFYNLLLLSYINLTLMNHVFNNDNFYQFPVIVYVTYFVTL